LDTDDKILVARCKEGDRRAFQTIVSKYERRVYGIVIGMIRDKEEAWDLTQDVFVKIYRYLGTFEGNSALYTWIYRITVNSCLDYLRKKRIYKVEYDDSRGQKASVEVLFPLTGQASSGTPQKRLLREELMEKVNEALGQLSPKHKQMIILREVEGLAYQEIADVLEISIGTVMSRLFHARKHMQRILSKYLDKRQ
jgi:RNA polymerase sigma-70 factor, ECF subfamily